MSSSAAILLVWGSSRLLTFLVVAIGEAFVDPARPGGQHAEPLGVFSYWAHWDGRWFAHIAQHGYDSAAATAFFPLYPLVLSALHATGIGVALAGVIVSSLASLAALYFVFHLARNWHGEQAGLRIDPRPSVLPDGVLSQCRLQRRAVPGCHRRLSVGAVHTPERSVGRRLRLLRRCDQKHRRTPCRFAPVRVAAGPPRVRVERAPRSVRPSGRSARVHALSRAHQGRPAQLLVRVSPVLGARLRQPDHDRAEHRRALAGRPHIPLPGSVAVDGGPRAVGRAVEHAQPLVPDLCRLRPVPGDHAPVGGILYAVPAALAPLALSDSRGLPLVSYPRYALVVFPLFIAVGAVVARRPAALVLWVIVSAAAGAYLTLLFVTWRWVA